ncbi:MAG: hypothetical protein MPI95_07195 [Nitrosopumilus sp.]|nr:hypothetical protein [Nitrosopumilus sp.]CAI9831224.1 conserved hypothetical protein [Nitrosopumilaceae archaeon]MDA7940747.1 hypothetical protein [Nitrosopumilus sp.]MDA7942955.1 hypothetical protein [Nitrosopumilus sp.]MDA7944634.1 hypothetical protein [Nitrosopumilus sp.]
MPDYVCAECGKRLFHENETTLKVQQTIHSKFCRKKDGEYHSYMHRDPAHMEPFDPERENDSTGQPVLKR